MMKFENNKEEFNLSWKETWFLEKLDYKASMELEIHLIGGKIETPEDIIVGGVNLGEANPVVWDPSKRIIISFFQPLTFQRLDESFASEKNGTFVGERYRIYSDSEYLRYFSKISFGIVDEPIHHYSITCADDIIDVLSINPPVIEKK